GLTTPAREARNSPTGTLSLMLVSRVRWENSVIISRLGTGKPVFVIPGTRARIWPLGRSASLDCEKLFWMPIQLRPLIRSSASLAIIARRLGAGFMLRFKTPASLSYPWVTQRLTGTYLIFLPDRSHLRLAVSIAERE